MRSSRYHSNKNEGKPRKKSIRLGHSPILHSRLPNRKNIIGDQIFINDDTLENTSVISHLAEPKSDYSSEFYSSDEDDKNHPGYFAEIKEHRFH